MNQRATKSYAFKQIPNKSILNVARQFRMAANLIRKDKVTNSAGGAAIVVNATLSLELYIKALDGEMVFENPNDIGNGVKTYERVYNKSSIRGHRLIDLYNGLPPDIRKNLETAFMTKCSNSNLVDALRPFDNAFVEWRYIFEGGVMSACITDLMDLSDFFEDFSNHYSPNMNP